MRTFISVWDFGTTLCKAWYQRFDLKVPPRRKGTTGTFKSSGRCL